jgi:hypothetical protein
VGLNTPCVAHGYLLILSNSFVCSIFRCESERVEIGVFQFEPEPHGLPGQWADVVSGLPRDNPVKLVAVLQITIG